VSAIDVMGTFRSITLPLYESSLRGPAEAAFCVSMNAANISCSCAPLGVPEPPLFAASALLALDLAFPFTLLPFATLILHVGVQVPAFLTAVRIRLVV
jgi:hypothetical protein